MADLTLEAIPSYRRPMGAQRVLGERDELGNPVYRTVGGRKFSLVTMTGEEAEEQREMDRWPLGKVASDFRDTVWDYVSNPSLPSWDQVKRLPSALMQGMTEEIQGAIDNPTPASILGLAVGAGTGSLAGAAPKGALRVFGGLYSDERRVERTLEEINQRVGPYDTIEEAVLDIGPDAIYDEYGIFLGLDGEARYEIPDIGISLTAKLPENIDNAIAPDIKKEYEEPDTTFLTDEEALDVLEEHQRKLREGIKYDGVTLGELLDHPRLYEAYPELEDLPVAIVTGGEAASYDAAFYSIERGIELSWDNLITEPGAGLDELNEVILPTLMHEVQHAIQDIEGFDTGANPSMTNIGPSALPRLEARMQDIDRRLKFLDAELSSGDTFLGRHNEWVDVPENEVPIDIKQMSESKAAGRGWIFTRSKGWRYLQDGYFVDTANGVEWRAGDPETLSTISHSTVTPEQMVRSPEMYQDNVTFTHKGTTYYASPNHVFDRDKKLNTSTKDLLTHDFLRRVATDGRAAYQKYRMTTGELEANAVGSRVRLTRRLERKFGPDRARRTLKEAGPERTLGDEIEAAGGGEVIARPNIPTE